MYSRMPARSFDQMNGSTKFAVPTWTAVAPAIMNSSASRASAIPPMPMIGIFTACRHSYTIRTAIGRIAGPLNPPTMFEIFGRRVSTSMTIARNVFTSDTASAPPSSAARANDAKPAGSQQARRCLDDTRGGMPFALGEKQAFGDDAAKRREVHDIGVLHAIAETSARGEERVLQGERADAD